MTTKAARQDSPTAQPFELPSEDLQPIWSTLSTPDLCRKAHAEGASALAFGMAYPKVGSEN
jgi:hypothetical protein